MQKIRDIMNEWPTKAEGNNILEDRKFHENLNKFIEKFDKINNIKSEISKLSNMSLNDENLNMLDQREESVKYYESLRNSSDEIKLIIDSMQSPKSDEEIKKILLSTIDNIVISHKSINESISAIENSISKTLNKIEKKSSNLRKIDKWQYVMIAMILYILINLVLIFKKFSDNPVIKKKKIDHEKLFDSIV